MSTARIAIMFAEDTGRHKNTSVYIWEIFYSVGQHILTQPVKYRHLDTIKTSSSWTKLGTQVGHNLKAKAFVFSMSLNLQTHLILTQEEEQNKPLLKTDAQNTCSDNNADEQLQTTNKTTSPTRYIGLENQGATCYFNTALQLLYMTEEFRAAVERHKSDDSLFKCIADLFKRLNSGSESPATTEEITANLKINVHKQEDAAKYFQKLLNRVDPELSKVFQGVTAQTTVCINPVNDHEPLEQVKTFFILSISLDSDSKPPVCVQRCYDSYFSTITMRGEGQQVNCKGCRKMMDTDITSSLRKLPPVLVLHLERFEFDYDSMCCVKNYSTVKIPVQLSVKEESGINHRYDLYAIANHAGSLNGGHYYADIRDSNKQWYRFDDSKVEEMSFCKLSEAAYLLLYRKYTVQQMSHSDITATNELTEHIIIDINDNQDSGCTVEHEQDQDDIQNTRDSDINIEVEPSENRVDDSTPDPEIKSDKDDDYNQTKTAENHNKRANTHPEDHPEPPKHGRLSDSEITATNELTEHIIIDINDNQDSGCTVEHEQDQHDIQNTRDSDIQIGVEPSETWTDDSTPDPEIQLEENDNHIQAETPEMHTESADTHPEPSKTWTSHCTPGLEIQSGKDENHSHLETSEAHNEKVSTPLEEDHSEPQKHRRHNDSDSVQINQLTKQVSTKTDNNQDSTVEHEQNQLDLQNTSDSDINIEVKKCWTGQSTPDLEIQTYEDDEDHSQTKPINPSTSDQDSDESDPLNEAKTTQSNTRQTARAKCIRICLAAVLAVLIIFLLYFLTSSGYCPSQLLIPGIVQLLFCLVCLLVIVVYIFNMSYLLPFRFTTVRRHGSNHLGVNVSKIKPDKKKKIP